jgi:hypothetical protein
VNSVGAAALAAGVVVVHLAFVLFVASGGLLALRWPKAAFIHLPAAAWAAYVELAGEICPLTPVENRLRAAAGLDAYTGDFIAQYLFRVLYPEGLTREAQIVIGTCVIAANAVLYGWLVHRWRRRRITSESW